MRKLASVQKIAEKKPIEGADMIEAVRVNGWWMVTQKSNNFDVGDLVVYFEVDSFLPVREEFEFLRKSCFKTTQHLGDGFRLRTIKLRGQVSQGLVLPLDTINVAGFMEEGQDLTEFLGVKKWETPLPASLAGKAKGIFPSFIRKTDQERIQNVYEDLKKTHENMLFEATLKLDGSSMTVYLKDGVFGVCSRNLDLLETEENTFWQVARKMNLEETLRSLGRNIALQGELMGPGIQGNREGLKEHTFYLFDVWSIDEQIYLSPMERDDTVFDLRDQGSYVQHVPVLDVVFPLQKSLDDLIAASDIKSLNHQVAEGIVYKAMDGSTSFKVINNKFLLNEK